MKRLFFLAPALESVKSISSELKAIGIDDNNLHVVGKDHQAISEAHIHEANLLQTTDFLPSLKRGGVVGLCVGIILGLLAYNFPPGEHIELSYGVIVGLSIFGLVFGAWVSSMVGVSIQDPVVEKYSDSIKSGNFLMIVDVSKESEKVVCNCILKHHPEVKIAKYYLKK